MQYEKQLELQSEAKEESDEINNMQPEPKDVSPPSRLTQKDVANTSLSLLKALASKSEALKLFEEKLGRVRDLAVRYRDPSSAEDSAGLGAKHLSALAAEVGAICGYDLSRLPRFIREQRPQGGLVPVEEFISLARQWLGSEQRIDTSALLNELSEDKKTVRMSSIDTFRKGFSQNGQKLR